MGFRERERTERDRERDEKNILLLMYLALLYFEKLSKVPPATAYGIRFVKT
jgi:hypothetical protein